MVSAAELNAVYANPGTKSPWLAPTNAADFGGNVTFGPANSVADNYSIHYATNLGAWFYLGPARPFD